MPRNNRLVQLFGLAALGIALGLLAQMIFGPPANRSTEPPRAFSFPLEAESAAEELKGPGKP